MKKLLGVLIVLLLMSLVAGCDARKATDKKVAIFDGLIMEWIPGGHCRFEFTQGGKWLVGVRSGQDVFGPHVHNVDLKDPKSKTRVLGGPTLAEATSITIEATDPDGSQVKYIYYPYP